MPIAVVREAALQQNIEVFAEYCRANDVELAPHAKTTMSREIVGRQLAAGAWGATVASVSQLKAVQAWGVTRILLASQVVDPRSARRSGSHERV